MLSSEDFILEGVIEKVRGHGQTGMLGHCGTDAWEREGMKAGRLARRPVQPPGERWRICRNAVAVRMENRG